MEEINYNSLSSYATTSKIVSILAKQRVKHEIKLYKARQGERTEPRLEEELSSMMPSSFTFKKTSNVYVLRESLTNYLVHRLEEGCQHDYVKNLSAFVEKIKKIVAEGEFTFCKPNIIPKLKEEEKDEEGRVVAKIYRPLSAYSDLTTKTVIALMSEWFTDVFDSYYHYEMLAYRKAREYHGSVHVTSNQDAVGTIKEYIQSHKDQPIYVAECDIQKFFDIIHHGVVLDCFDKLVAKVKVDNPNLDVTSARKLLVSFLGSYSFYHDVYSKNDDKEFWVRSLGPNYDGGKHMIKWIKEKQARTLGDMADLGIPQGAALSTVITNMVLSSVDEPVLMGDDPDRFFVRFCDDILLMHTDRDRCEGLASIYAGSLSAHRLIYHDFKDVSTLPNGKRNNWLESDSNYNYWSAKSKKPFLWAEDLFDANSASWIGFLGFEFSRNGDVRIRRSSVGKKVDKMLKDYHQIKNGKDDELRRTHLRYFKSMRICVPSSAAEQDNLLKSYVGITDNSYTRHQIEKMNSFKDKCLRKLEID